MRTDRILYIHAGGRRERLERMEAGEHLPSEFFYGLPELRSMGYSVDLMDLSDLSPATGTLRYKKASIKDWYRFKRTVMNHCERLFVDAVEKVRGYDIVIAGNEYVALGLGDFLRGGKTPRLFFFAMGMLSKPLRLYPEGHGVQRRAIARYRHLIEQSSGVMYLGLPELEKARQLFPDLTERLFYSSFGIDASFWTPKNGRQDDDGYFLFVGKDANRDVKTLLKVAEGMPNHRFVALTSLLENVPNVPENLEVIRGSWKHELVTDERVRDLYRGARAVVLPVLETYQPSGQSVALQAMACATPVVISDFPGFWNRAAYADGKNICFTPCGDHEKMIKALEKLATDSPYARTVGERARQVILDHFTTEHFAEAIIRAVDQADG